MFNAHYHRYNAGPVRVLADHANAVTSIAWSPTHTDLLASGSNDRSVNIWNLRASPHFAMAHIDGFSSGVFLISRDVINCLVDS